MTKMQRLANRLRAVRNALTPPEPAWRGAVIALWLLVSLITFVLLITEIVPDFSFAKLAGFLVAVSALLLAGVALRLTLWLLSMLPGRYRAGLFLLLPLLLALVLPGAGPKGGGVLVFTLLVITALIGGGIAVLRAQGFRPREQKTLLASIGIGLALLIGGIVSLAGPAGPQNPALTDFHLEDRTLELLDPGQPGDHIVATMSYGSGTDLHRSEFAAAADVVSRSVDGSKLIDNWEGPSGWLRTKYWGFDSTQLPLQGLVWYPEGDGPFPLALIVHGNHGMEDSSDPGYAYLGELLASRGTILVSVDENFLNSSFADFADIKSPGLKEENDARGWLLLEHLAQWSEWNAEPSHPLSGKIDIDRVALIGHSRGGEAVAIAAAFNRLERYPDDATLAFDYGFNIRGIIAIAPADRQYEPRERSTPLRGVNYFTIHGSMDGDVSSFMGSSQYSRVELDHDSASALLNFKSTLYITGANHGQFNTSWGRNDYGGLWGLALDTRPIMDPEEQRSIAKVYFSAFFEVVLHDKLDYLPIFGDARNAAQWIPDTFYLQNLANSSDLVVASFEEDLDPSTATLEGGRIETEHLSKWREEWISLKWNTLDTHVAVIAWDDEAEEGIASFAVTLPLENLPTHAQSQLVFSLSAADEGTLPIDWDEDENEAEDEEDTEEDDEEEAKPLDWSIVLTDSTGEEARLPLSHDRPLYPQVHAPTRRASILEMSDLSEVIFHRHSYRLGDFAEANQAFDVSAIHEIRFVFDLDEKGVIVIDDLGFANIAPPEEKMASGPREEPGRLGEQTSRPD